MAPSSGGGGLAPVLTRSQEFPPRRLDSCGGFRILATGNPVRTKARSPLCSHVVALVVSSVLVGWVGPLSSVPVATAASTMIYSLYRVTSRTLEERQKTVALLFALVPGLGVAAVCDLLFPSPPFRGAFWVILGVVCPIVVWRIGAWLTDRGFRWQQLCKSSVWRQRATAVTLGIVIVPLIIVSFATLHRPSPGDYWTSLTPLDVLVRGNSWGDKYGQLHYRCESNSMHNGCPAYVEGTCIWFEPSQDPSCLFVDCRDEGAEGRVCPDAYGVEVRRGSYGGMVAARRGRGVQDNAAYLLTALEDRSGDHGHAIQGPRLTAFAIRHAVRVPVIWTLFAIAGVFFAGLDLWRNRRGLESEKIGPSGVVARIRRAWHDEDEPEGEDLWSQVVLLVLVISCTPMWSAFVLGVGR